MMRERIPPFGLRDILLKTMGRGLKRHRWFYIGHAAGHHAEHEVNAQPERDPEGRQMRVYLPASAITNTNEFDNEFRGGATRLHTLIIYCGFLPAVYRDNRIFWALGNHWVTDYPAAYYSFLNRRLQHRKGGIVLEEEMTEEERPRRVRGS